MLDPTYTKHHVENFPIPPPTWSSKESTSIWEHFKSILANINIWLKRRGLKCIKIKPRKDFDTTGPISLKSEIRGKGKDGTFGLASEPRVPSLPKLIVKGGKAIGWVLEVETTEPQKIQIDSSDDEFSP